MDPVGLFRVARENFWPVLQESAFLKRGVLTPEEFVRAGDQLVRTCGTWQWEKGDPANIKPWLPTDKQFLLIRRVPSYRRVKALQGANVQEVSIAAEGENGEDWCAPVFKEVQSSAISAEGDEFVDDIDIPGYTAKPSSSSSSTQVPTSVDYILYTMFP